MHKAKGCKGAIRMWLEVASLDPVQVLDSEVAQQTHSDAKVNIPKSRTVL